MALRSPISPIGKRSPRGSRLQPSIGDSAPDFTLTDINGNAAALSLFWNARPVVLVFLRHFGCPFCREQVVLLRREYLKFKAVGAEIVCIAQGSPKTAKAFSIMMDIQYPILVCGDDLTIYNEYGLSRGSLGQMIGVEVILRSFKALMQGFDLGPVEGNTQQMPGTFVINTSGKIIFARRAVHQADNVSATELLECIQQNR
jgi:peroxiredoxin